MLDGFRADVRHEGAGMPWNGGEQQQLHSDNILTYQIGSSILRINKREAFIMRGGEAKNGEASV